MGCGDESPAGCGAAPHGFKLDSHVDISDMIDQLIFLGYTIVASFTSVDYRR